MKTRAVNFQEAWGFCPAGSGGTETGNGNGVISSFLTEFFPFSSMLFLFSTPFVQESQQGSGLKEPVMPHRTPNYEAHVPLL